MKNKVQKIVAGTIVGLILLASSYNKPVEVSRKEKPFEQRIEEAIPFGHNCQIADYSDNLTGEVIGRRVSYGDNLTGETCYKSVPFNR